MVRNQYVTNAEEMNFDTGVQDTLVCRVCVAEPLTADAIRRLDEQD
jgi:hypothetical protein